MPLYSYTYSIPYILFLLFLVLLMFLEFRCIKYDQKTYIIRLATITGFLFFFGLRGFVFTDWMNYYPLFAKIPTLFGGHMNMIFNNFSTNTEAGFRGTELGFVYLTSLFKTIIPNYFIWVFFNTLIDVILLDIFFRRYSKYYVLSFILFLTFGGLGIEINLIRNSKAILLFLVSIKYLQNRQILPYMLLNVLGCFFHASALIFLPLYFILNKDWPKSVLWIIFIAGNIIFLFHINYLRPVLTTLGDIIGGKIMLMIRAYLEIHLYNRPFGIGLGYIERILTFIIIIFSYDMLKKQNISSVIFINTFILYFIVYFFFAEITVAVERLSLLFVSSYWILYPNILKLIKKQNNKIILTFSFLFYCLLKITVGNSNVFSKYDNLLFGIESYEVRKDRVNKSIEEVLLKR